MAETEDFVVETVDLNSEFFEKHVQFLTKITVKKLAEGKFEVRLPAEVESRAVFVKHFVYLCWYWYMNTAIEKIAQEEVSKGKIPSYTV
jgi:hypothetical protein